MVTGIALCLIGFAATSLVLIFFPQPWVSRLGNLIVVVASGAGCILFVDTSDFRFAAISIAGVLVGGALVFVPCVSRGRLTP